MERPNGEEKPMKSMQNNETGQLRMGLTENSQIKMALNK